MKRFMSILILGGIALISCLPTLTAQQDSPAASTQEKPSAQEETPSISQMSEMELIEHVETLQKQLQSVQISERDEAERLLKAAGPVALDFLDLPSDKLTTDAQERLVRIRAVLEKQAIESVSKPSRVTLTGSKSLEEVFQAIRRQTRNNVSVVDEVGIDFMKQKVLMNCEDAEFWVAMDQVMTQANLVTAPYSGQAGQLKLAPATQQEETIEAAEITIPRSNAGVFNILVNRIDSSRNLLEPQTNHSKVNVNIRWEPRIRPISVDLPMAKFVVTDEFDQKVAVSNQESVLSGVVQPQIPELDFNISLKLVDRQIEFLKSIEGTIDAVLPGRVESFTFPNLDDEAQNSEITKAGVKVAFRRSRKNDDIWSIQMDVGFAENSTASESYLGWVYENEAYLVDKDGNRHDNIGYESYTAAESRVGVQYFFDVDPQKCSFVYKSPAAIVKMPIKFKLEKIPLP